MIILAVQCVHACHVISVLEGCSAHKEWVLKSRFMVLSDNCYPSKIMGYHSSTADMNFFSMRHCSLTHSLCAKLHHIEQKRPIYRTRAMANRSRIITAPHKKHAIFCFLFHFWAKVSSQKEEKTNYHRGLPWRAYSTSYSTTKVNSNYLALLLLVSTSSFLTLFLLNF